MINLFKIHSTKRQVVFLVYLIKLFLVFIVLSIVFCLVLRLFAFQSKDFSVGSYYAVFLSNGQVYFGHIQKLDGQVLSLGDVYYFRANTNLQDAQTKNQSDATNVELSLIKLGKELHGPTGTMMINRTSILFWEELRDNGKVVQAIKRYAVQ